MNFTSKLPTIGTNIFTTMSNLAKEHDAINLSQGFPNFPSDQKLITLFAKAMRNGYNQYAPMLGVLSLRVAIATKFQDLYNTSYNPESEIVITSGATQAIYSIISTFIRPDDEVILFKPAYDCYEPAIHINGGKAVSIQLLHPEYAVDWTEVNTAITDKTKMIIINTPQNPSGSIFSKEDMLALEKITKNTDIIVLSDEVYEHMIYDDEQHQSICLFPELKKRSFITASFGKTFHNTGWKVGYCCGPSELMQEFIKVHQFTVFCVNHPVQIALAEYLQDSSTYTNLSLFFQQKRDLFLEAISGSKFTYTPTKATYFQLLDYHQLSASSDIDFAKELTVKHGVAAIPLSVFNTNSLDFKSLRFCFAKTDETLLKAAEILIKL
ncbi:MAG: aminotransferase class I/II-fold pyridoxal phosphate-dependent enzyme [Flavobacteriaceae bacterium]